MDLPRPPKSEIQPIQPRPIDAPFRKRLPIELVITVPGLHTLQGVSIACDKAMAARTQKWTNFGPLFNGKD